MVQHEDRDCAAGHEEASLPDKGSYSHAPIGRPGETSANDDEGAGSIDFRRILKFALSVVLKTGLLLLFHVLGWLKLAPVVESWGFWGVVATAAILAAVCTLLVLLGLAVFNVGFVFTCGLIIVLVPFVGYFLMKALLMFAPQFVSAPNDHWFVLLLLGTALLLVTVPFKRIRKPQQPASHRQTGGRQ